MTWLIAVLAGACLAAFGLLVSLWLSWWIEQRAERDREYRAVPQGSLIYGGGLLGRRTLADPDHPDWPRWAAVTFDDDMITQRAEPGSEGDPERPNREMRDTWT